MRTSSLPDGSYLTCARDVDVSPGGETRAMLMRNRLFVQEAGLRPQVLTFSAVPDHARRRDECLELGLLVPEISLLNIYEHYRDHDWIGLDGDGRAPADLPPGHVFEEVRQDGSPWRRVHEDSRGTIVDEYLRDDGTPYLRIPRHALASAETWPRSIQAISRTRQVVGEFKNLGQWFRHWVRELTADAERSFVFMESRWVVPHLVPMKSDRHYLIYVLHNMHVDSPRQWNSPTTEAYERVMRRVRGMDAMVMLTERQRQDIAERIGSTNNLFVIPNPVQMPEVPSGGDRDPHRAAIVARLESQKRLGHAIQAFQRVVAEVPDARLDVYGDGSRRTDLEAHAERLGLTEAVVFHGHHLRARDALSRSSAFLLSSYFEGYPLATLESMSHGCPVVSYDIKYGPQEQIDDGVDGFLVPPGDVDALAERTIRLLTSPELVEKMGAAARRKAAAHGLDTYLASWAAVLQRVVEAKGRRVGLKSADLTLDRLEARRSIISPGWGPRRQLPGRFGEDDVLVVAGTIVLDARGPALDVAEARVELSAVCDATGDVVPLPSRSEVRGPALHVSSQFPLSRLGSFGVGAPATLRLRVVWHNTSWETILQRRPTTDARVEAWFDLDGTLRLGRPDGSGEVAPQPADVEQRSRDVLGAG